MPIGYEADGSIMTLTIQGADDSNRITEAMTIELNRRLAEFSGDPRLRVAILRGAGDRHFSAGRDLDEAKEAGQA